MFFRKNVITKIQMNYTSEQRLGVAKGILAFEWFRCIPLISEVPWCH